MRLQRKASCPLKVDFTVDIEAVPTFIQTNFQLK
jgi:hypothetical protein